MTRLEKMKWFLKLLYYNNVKRHIGDWKWKRQLKNDPSILEQWISEGHDPNLLKNMKTGGLSMKAVEYGMKLAKELNNENY